MKVAIHIPDDKADTLERMRAISKKLNITMADILIKGIQYFENLTYKPELMQAIKERGEIEKKIEGLLNQRCINEVLIDLHQDLKEWKFTTRTYSCLKSAGITTVAQLLEVSDAKFLQIKNMGRKSLNEIKFEIERRNLSRTCYR